MNIYSLDCKEGIMKKNKCVCLFVCLHGVKKTFSMIFYFRAHWSKKHGLGRDQKSKNIVSFRVQRSKKHFLWFSGFVPIGRKNIVLVEIKSRKTLLPSGFKGQNNIFYFQAEYRKNMDGSSSKVNSREMIWDFGVEESVSTGAFLKHGLQVVLQYTAKSLDPPPSPSRDRQWQTMERRWKSLSRL